MEKKILTPKLDSTPSETQVLTNEEIQNIKGGKLGRIVTILRQWWDKNSGRIYAVIKVIWFDIVKWCWTSATWTYSKEDVYRKYGIRLK